VSKGHQKSPRAARITWTLAAVYSPATRFSCIASDAAVEAMNARTGTPFRRGAAATLERRERGKKKTPQNQNPSSSIERGSRRGRAHLGPNRNRGAAAAERSEGSMREGRGPAAAPVERRRRRSARMWGGEGGGRRRSAIRGDAGLGSPSPCRLLVAGGKAGGGGFRGAGSG